MTDLVADASALVEYLLQTTASEPYAVELERPAVRISVPALCDVEVCAALRRALHLKVITEERAAQAMEDYGDLPIARHGHMALLPRIFALRDNFSPYDATYVALAEQLGARLLTADLRLGRAIAAHLPGLTLVLDAE